MTMTAIAAPATAAPAPTGSLAPVIDAAEAHLAKTPPRRSARVVERPEDLLPVVLADRVVWRHLVTGDDALLAMRVIAQALDAAHGMICAARQHAPRSWQLLAVQAAAYTTLRTRLSGVAEALAWALEVAHGDAVAMTVRVGRTFERDYRGRRVPLCTVNLTLRN